MRNELCRELVARSEKPDMVFLTGDLGFMALEPLQDAMQARFINCGVAEQNMISVAAAMSSEGLEAWTYTIAPFCYARALEQIRNDVCFHALPVKMLANGGGYGYGVMGPTHHALEDYGILLTLPNLRVFVPAFAEDVEAASLGRASATEAVYLRLGQGELPKGQKAPRLCALAPIDGWRCGRDDRRRPAGGFVLAGAAVVGRRNRGRPFGSLRNCRSTPIRRRPNCCRLWRGRSVSPLSRNMSRRAALANPSCACFWSTAFRVNVFRHLCAKGYPSGTYGSQAFLRRCSGLGPHEHS